MSFIKYADFEDYKIENTESCSIEVNQEALNAFQKYASDLKRVAPRADDFLYFSAIMMHAAEASGINDDGTPKLNAKGEEVKVGWDTRNDTWKWTTNDPNIKPYKNFNGDIFPEVELIKAYKKWIHKPLCIDHKSSSVDHTRGFIVDTIYDRNLKRVIALCALDKINYPDLARKVSTRMQTNVSMGTAVQRAICTEEGCHRVAMAEVDFCKHMKNKSGYGEINIGLNPMELSIVVNGADPKASIKQILASVNRLNTYIENKNKELNKLAKLEYTLDAQLTVLPGEGDSGTGTTINVSSKDLESFKRDLEKAYDDLKELNKDANNLSFDKQEQNKEDLNDGQEELTTPNLDSKLAPPHDRFASSSIDELHKTTLAIEAKLNNMKQSLNKLAQAHEENMASREMNKQGYYQGTEEPTPGQAKYPKDPLNEKVRMEAKHMEGQGPFPDVGPVDGMYPGVDSVNMSELERKKMLARAVSEERSIRRQAIVDLAKKALEDKKAYFQNGDDKNPGSPTPGQVKYPIDKGHMAYEDDKHMHGQKPFPDVGSVDGMHPSPASADISDEKKRKEMLSRAGTLHGKFVRASRSDGTRDLDNSSWEIRLGDKLLLSASVKDLSGGRSEMMYDSINTAEFGQRLLEKVKVHGADKIRNLVKNGQDQAGAPAASAPPAGPPSLDAGPPSSPAIPEDTGKSGDPKDSALALAEKVRDLGSDLVEAIRALTGEQAEMGTDMGAPPAPDAGAGVTTASDFSLDHMNVLRGELNGSLTLAMKEVLAELNDRGEELEKIVDIYNKGNVSPANADFVGGIVSDAMVEAKAAVVNGFRLMTAFVKYARGTKAIVKRAEIEAELQALAEGEDLMNVENSDGSDSSQDNDLMSLMEEDPSASTLGDGDSDLEVPSLDDDEGGDSHPDDYETCAHCGFDHTYEPEEANNFHSENPSDEDKEDNFGGVNDSGINDSNDLMAKPEELKDLVVKPGTNVQVTAGFNSKAQRAVLRAKLAADVTGKEDDGQIQDMSKQKFSDMLDEADRLTDGQTKLDTKPSDNLGYVETAPEINKAMMDLAKAPPKVRKEAEAIHRLISEGKLDPSDLDTLISEADLDKDAVAYYKKYYNQVDGGSEFASELVKEHAKAQLEDNLTKFKLKMARAYEMAYDMVSRGLCHNDKIAISSQVEEIMKFNDDSFDSLKRVISKHQPTMHKEAGRLPQNGVIGSGEMSSYSNDEDDWSLLSTAFTKTSKRMF